MGCKITRISSNESKYTLFYINKILGCFVNLIHINVAYY